MMFVTKYVLKYKNPDQRTVESGKLYLGPNNTLVPLFDALMYPMRDHAENYSEALTKTEVKEIRITMEEVN